MRRIAVGISVFCVASVTILLAMSSGVEAETISGGKATHYRIIAGFWKETETNVRHIRTSYKIFSLNPIDNILLRDIHVVEPDGTRHVWGDLLVRTLLLPRGSRGTHPSARLHSEAWATRSQPQRVPGRVRAALPREPGPRKQGRAQRPGNRPTGKPLQNSLPL